MKAIDTPGDFVFVVGVKTRGKVWAYRTSDGSFVGNLLPDQIVGASRPSGGVDMPHGLAAVHRRSGEYVVFVGKDHRAKMLL